MQPQVSKAAYVNFLDQDEGADRIRAAYGDNYERLVDAQAAVRSDQLLPMNQNIRPD